MFIYLAILKKDLQSDDQSIVDFCHYNNAKIIEEYKNLGILKIAAYTKLELDDALKEKFDVFEQERDDFIAFNEEE